MVASKVTFVRLAQLVANFRCESLLALRFGPRGGVQVLLQSGYKGALKNQIQLFKYRYSDFCLGIVKSRAESIH